MIVCKTINELNQALNNVGNQHKTIGFVPTMGALHEGHLSLIKRAQLECDVVVVSIFINPTQFNNREDFEKYPRLYNTDIKMLKESGACDIVFAPDEKEMYPTPDHRRFDLGYFEEIMEGKYRPGHFQGVAQIVTKLFDIVKPHKAYFGKKDFQQLAVIRKIVKDLQYPIEIIGCEIIREPNGLAMSSRNLRLSKSDFDNAGIIFNTLNAAKNWIKENIALEEIKTRVKNQIEAIPPFKVEYIEIVDSCTLLPVTNINNHRSIHCCIAVYCNDVRLIDNMEIKL